MVSKKIIKNADGMYPVEYTLLDDLPNEEYEKAFGDLLQNMAKATPDLNTRLADVLKYVKDIRNFYRDNKPINEVEKDICSDARLVQIAIERALPYLCGKGEINKALATAFDAGKLFERIYARGFENDVIHARRSKKGLNKGREKKAEKTTDRRKKITDAVKARLAANSRDSLTSARQYVADNSLAIIGKTISFDAAKRATATMKPRKKIKK